MRKFFAVLVVLIGFLTSFYVISDPTTQPVETEVSGMEFASPTSIPTSSSTPMSEPTEASTEDSPQTLIEIPTYVGLTAEEVDKLREQCLQDKHGSFCLPLPVDPTRLGVSITEASFTHNYFVDDRKYEVEETYLSVAVQRGVEFIAPVSGELQVEYNFAYVGSNIQELFLTEICWRIESFSLCLRTLDGTPLEEEMLKIFGGSRSVSVGEVLAEATSEQLVASIWSYRKDSLPNGEEILRSEITLSDLLRDELGRVVYVSNSSRRVWNLEEAFAHISQNCKPVNLDDGDSAQVAVYAKRIASRIGFSTDERLGTLVDPDSGCAIVSYGPRGELGLFFYENVEGWIQILQTEPLR